jgi:hypothetical protein
VLGVGSFVCLAARSSVFVIVGCMLLHVSGGDGSRVMTSASVHLLFWFLQSWALMAASSSGDAPLSTNSDDKEPIELATDVVVKPTRKPPRILKRVPMAEYIFLDQISEEDTVLVNAFTYEKARLAGLGWEIVADDETGDPSVLTWADDDGENCRSIDIDELLKSSVYRDESSGEVMIREALPMNQCKWSSLVDRCVRFKAGTVFLRVGLTPAEDTIEVYTFVRARLCNQRLFFSLHSLYAILGLDCHNGQASKWVWSSDARWSTFFYQLFGGQKHLIYSTFLRDSSLIRKELSFKDRCLPHTAVSTLGLLSLLARFSFLPRERGGMESDEKRMVAKQVAQALISGCVGDWTIDVELASMWQCIW